MDISEAVDGEAVVTSVAEDAVVVTSVEVADA